MSAEEFHAFDEPGFARAAWNFKVSSKQGGTLLETETRVQCTDEVARRKFLRYWRFIGLFSGLVRLEMLRGINNSFS